MSGFSCFKEKPLQRRNFIPEKHRSIKIRRNKCELKTTCNMISSLLSKDCIAQSLYSEGLLMEEVLLFCH